jgi:hypothetical protein
VIVQVIVQVIVDVSYINEQLKGKTAMSSLNISKINVPIEFVFVNLKICEMVYRFKSKNYRRGTDVWWFSVTS